MSQPGLLRRYLRSSGGDLWWPEYLCREQKKKEVQDFHPGDGCVCKRDTNILDLFHWLDFGKSKLQTYLFNLNHNVFSSTSQSWFGHLIRMPPGDPGDDPGHAGGVYISQLDWKRLWIPQRELESDAGEREVRISPLGLLPPRPDPGLSGWKWKDGWKGHTNRCLISLTWLWKSQLQTSSFNPNHDLFP